MSDMSDSEDPEIESVELEPKPRQESQFSRWSGITLMVALLFVAGILSALTAMRFAIRGREVVVPSVTGKTEDQAAEILASSGLHLKVSSKRFNSETPEGHVVDQIPPSGTRLK